jgi:hypothetical protein
MIFSAKALADFVGWALPTRIAKRFSFDLGDVHPTLLFISVTTAAVKFLIFTKAMWPPTFFDESRAGEVFKDSFQMMP